MALLLCNEPLRIVFDAQFQSPSYYIFFPHLSPQAAVPIRRSPLHDPRPRSAHAFFPASDHISASE